MLKKRDWLKFFIIFNLLFFLSGCAMPTWLKKAPAEKLQQKVEKVDNSQKLLEENKDKIQDKGKAFVYGAQYTLNQETNKTPAVRATGSFLDLASLTLGPPSAQDARTIREISDGLLQEYKVELALAQAAAANSEEDAKKFKKQAETAQKEVDSAQRKLDDFSADVINLQKKNELLNIALNKNLTELEKVNKENSILASKWVEENSFINSINPFSSLMDFFKKLFGWAIFLGVVFIIFKVLEIFFPGLGVLSILGSLAVKFLSKLIPGAIKTAGYVGNGAMKALNQVVKANHNIFQDLEKLPLEDKLVENYPDDHKFSKKETLALLYQLTDDTLNAFKSELGKQTDAESRGYISKAKIETGIKDEKEVSI